MNIWVSFLRQGMIDSTYYPQIFGYSNEALFLGGSVLYTIYIKEMPKFLKRRPCVSVWMQFETHAANLHKWGTFFLCFPIRVVVVDRKIMDKIDP